MYGTKYQLDIAERLFGLREGIARIRAGEDPAAVASSWAAGEAQWRLMRNKYSCTGEGFRFYGSKGSKVGF